MTDQEAQDLANSHTDEQMLEQVTTLIEMFLKHENSRVLVDWKNERLSEPLQRFLSYASVWKQKHAVKCELDLQRALFCNDIISLPSKRRPKPPPGIENK